MSEQFSSGTINAKQTNTKIGIQVKKRENSNNKNPIGMNK